MLLSPQPRLTTLPPTTLAGQRRPMSRRADTTAELWREFQQLLRGLGWPAQAPRYSIQLYGAGYFEQFNPAAVFEKWAAVALPLGAAVPAGLAQLVLPGGLYAVFDYQEPASGAPALFSYLFGEWLPNSGYQLDTRPHFEVLPPGYQPAAPDAREEIWLPVRPRA